MKNVRPHPGPLPQGEEDAVARWSCIRGIQSTAPSQRSKGQMSNSPSPGGEYLFSGVWPSSATASSAFSSVRRGSGAKSLFSMAAPEDGRTPPNTDGGEGWGEGGSSSLLLAIPRDWHFVIRHSSFSS